MTALLLVAHGSRREASNLEIKDLVLRLRAMNNAFESIEAAFLELAEPSIGNALQDQIDAGHTRIVVLPYFLAAGQHVQQDIPQQVALISQRHPHVNIQIAQHLGANPEMASMLLKLALTQL
jgi:sirohydrochlorin ferrochelatase